jgi:hypothetical protein
VSECDREASIMRRPWPTRSCCAMAINNNKHMEDSTFEMLTVNSHIQWRSPAALIHTCHAATLPFSDSAASFVKVSLVDGNIRTASLLLVTTFVELRVVAVRSRTRAGRPHAVSGRPMLIHNTMPFPCRYNAALYRGPDRSLSERHGRGMAGKQHGMCGSNTVALCRSNGKDTI